MDSGRTPLNRLERVKRATSNTGRRLWRVNLGDPQTISGRVTSSPGHGTPMMNA